MILRTILGEQSLDYIPKIKNLIDERIGKNKDFEANQMTHFIMQKMLQSSTYICDMTDEQLNDLQDKLIDHFKIVGWI
jgi:hypothetical protein